MMMPNYCPHPNHLTRLTSNLIGIVRETRDYLADPDHWTQNANARRANCEETDIFNPDAERHCASGALRLIAGRRNIGMDHEGFNLIGHMLQGVSHELFQTELVPVNDRLGHAAVLKVFDVFLQRYEDDRVVMLSMQHRREAAQQLLHESIIMMAKPILVLPSIEQPQKEEERELVCV